MQVVFQSIEHHSKGEGGWSEIGHGLELELQHHGIVLPGQTGHTSGHSWTRQTGQFRSGLAVSLLDMVDLLRTVRELDSQFRERVQGLPKRGMRDRDSTQSLLIELEFCPRR